MNNFLKGILTLVAILLFFYVAVKFIFWNTREVCAHFERTSSMKGSTVYVYSYYDRGVRYEGIVSPTDFKLKGFENLKKMDCVKFECSTRFPSFAKCIDKRILK